MTSATTYGVAYGSGPFWALNLRQAVRLTDDFADDMRLAMERFGLSEQEAGWAFLIVARDANGKVMAVNDNVVGPDEVVDFEVIHVGDSIVTEANIRRNVGRWLLTRLGGWFTGIRQRQSGGS